MKTILRLFPFVRALEAELSRAGGDIRGLQGENHALRAEIEQLRLEREKASDSERRAYQTMVNIEMKAKHGFIPFPDSPAPPDPPESDMTPLNGHSEVRSLIHEEEAKFRAEIMEELMGVKE